LIILIGSKGKRSARHLIVRARAVDRLATPPVRRGAELLESPVPAGPRDCAGVVVLSVAILDVHPDVARVTHGILEQTRGRECSTSTAPREQLRDDVESREPERDEAYSADGLRDL